MNGTATKPAQDSSTFSFRYAKPSWEAWLLLLGVAFVYTATIKGLVLDWWRNPDYSHGLLLPFALAYLLWQKREKLLSMPIRPMWLGMFLIVTSQAINLLGFLGAEFFLQRFSLLIFISGLILFLWGPEQ